MERFQGTVLPVSPGGWWQGNKWAGKSEVCWRVPEGPGLTPTGLLPPCDRFFRGLGRAFPTYFGGKRCFGWFLVVKSREFGVRGVPAPRA